MDQTPAIKSDVRFRRYLISLLFLIGSLAVILLFFKREEIYRILSQASGRPANLVVGADRPLGNLPRPWAHLSQGGEDLTRNLLGEAIDKITPLRPATIRLDHIYDGYQVVSAGAGGKLDFDWSRLDAVVKSVVQTGAAPMLVLSYMPPAIAGGDLVSAPKDWRQWSWLVQKTIEHYSGEMAIPNMAYEVWNEPDLFGNWKTYGEKNYLDLYRWSEIGAENAAAVLPFKLGGPAVTAPYTAWTRNFLKFAQENSLRLDFFSWHRYSWDPDQYWQDKESVERIIQEFPAIAAKLEWYITEWGGDSGINPDYDRPQSAAHLAAVARLLLGQIDRLYTFEIVDGKDPAGRPFWGRWGLLAHPDFGLAAKPRWQALILLNKLNGLWLEVAGENRFVKAIPARGRDGVIRILVVNYDPQNRHTELAPLAVRGLPAGNYHFRQTALNGMSSAGAVTAGAGGTINLKLFLPPNEIILLEISPN